MVVGSPRIGDLGTVGGRFGARPMRSVGEVGSGLINSRFVRWLEGVEL